MKKALMNASVASMIYKFNMDNIRILQSLGYQVDVACNFDPAINPISKEEIEDCRRQLKKLHCRILDTSCPRSVTHFADMIKSYRQLKNIAERERYDLVHTQSPIGGVICRLAFRQAREKYGTRVIYQAHGFHFCKGAPLWNWLLYYPIEKYCSRLTDTLITITKEDESLAKRNFRCRDVRYVPGVGVDTSKYGCAVSTPAEQQETRKQLGIPQDAIWIMSVGELNENKNHDTVIRAIAELDENCRKKVYYTIAGQGEKKAALLELIERLHLQNKVQLLGYREDMPVLYDACDVFCIPSIREGLNVSLMEAMASGLPVIASRIRGNVDLVDEDGGKLFDPKSVQECSTAIAEIISSDSLVAEGLYNRSKIKHFDRKCIEKVIREQYEKLDDPNTGGANELMHLYHMMEIMKVRDSLGVKAEDVMILSVGELSARKNHQLMIKTLSNLDDTKPYKYFIAGRGPLEEKLRVMIAEQGMQNKIVLLGYRDDVNILTKAADIFAFPSIQEGLPVALMEAMSAGLTIAASNIRGVADLLEDNVGGFLFTPTLAVECQGAMTSILRLSDEKKNRFAAINESNIRNFSIENVHLRMKEIYSL